MSHSLPIPPPKRTPESRGLLAAPLAEYTLPSFSGVLMSALEKVRNPDANAAEVAAVLESDPGTSVKLLGIANSACYGLTAPVNSAAHAIALLGRGQVEALLLSVAVGGALPKPTIPELDGHRFWCGAARRATIARSLAQRIDPRRGSESFTAALLQDMAVPLLAEVKGAEYGAVLEAWRQERQDLAALERQRFGWDHAMVGAWMCQEWRFSSQVMRAIGAHHGVWDETDLPSVTAVGTLTDAERDYGAESVIEVAVERFGMSLPDAETLVAASETDAADLARLFI
ncbi:MAG: HDOD domain-containing protein [Myxococcales bacterium]|nr:HDOD domain-containing protein [Myxococcales bacterium]MDD9965974.1 HDOD domain-containing protein [Myxococcales bacterium]